MIIALRAIPIREGTLGGAVIDSAKCCWAAAVCMIVLVAKRDHYGKISLRDRQLLASRPRVWLQTSALCLVQKIAVRTKPLGGWQDFLCYLYGNWFLNLDDFVTAAAEGG